MPQNILSVKNLTVRLDDRDVLRDVSFDLANGENLAILGPNGSGKTVLLKTLLGMFPYVGEIIWAPRTKIGYVPQKIDADRHLPLNVQNLLEAKANVLKLPAAEIKSVAETVGLSPQGLKNPIGHLSGGQFQKALIAFALLGKPNLILFDEPTASLDQLAEEHIYELIEQLRTRYQITTLLVSHDLSVVFQYATKVLCLNQKNICFGSPKDALTPQILSELYGGPTKYFQHEHA